MDLNGMRKIEKLSNYIAGRDKIFFFILISISFHFYGCASATGNPNTSRASIIDKEASKASTDFSRLSVHHNNTARAWQNFQDGQTPIGVRRMPVDEGEMFMLDYWTFEGDEHDRGWPFQPAFVPHAIVNELGQPHQNHVGRDQEHHYPKKSQLNRDLSNGRLNHERSTLDSVNGEQHHLYDWISNQMGRPILNRRGTHNQLKSETIRRDFACPVDTKPCWAINRPNSCCQTSETCQLVTDVGLGDVGCCPDGKSCQGQVSACDITNGFKPCPGSQNGGCCLPGYSCLGVGCVSVSTIVTTTTVPITVVTYYQNPTSTAFETGSQQTTTLAQQGRDGDGNLSNTNPQNSPTNQLGHGGPTVTVTTTLPPPVTASPPVRPTGKSETTLTVTGCPNGFYMCTNSNNNQPDGCCRVGRDCSQSTCPATPSVTVVATGSVTVVVAVPTDQTPPGPASTAACATGWEGCPAIVGGGCCPSGFECVRQDGCDRRIGQNGVISVVGRQSSAPIANPKTGKAGSSLKFGYRFTLDHGRKKIGDCVVMNMILHSVLTKIVAGLVVGFVGGIRLF